MTGAGRGIGRATAIALARSGARVIVSARTKTEIETVGLEIRAAGGEARAQVMDVAERSQVQHLFETEGLVDILVNNAGVLAPIAPVASADPDEWAYNTQVNLLGVFLTSHYALQGMAQRGWGRIINVSSGAARGSVTSWSAYSAAKAGVETLTKVMAQEIEDSGVRVNAIRPGIVDTDMQADIRSSSRKLFGHENLERFRSYKERGLLRNPEDPARLILWLLSADADGVNGEVLAIDDEEVAVRLGLEPMSR